MLRARYIIASIAEFGRRACGISGIENVWNVSNFSFSLTFHAVNAIKIEHFRNLVSLSAADGKIEEVERIALSKIAYENGIPLDRLNIMLQRASEYIYLIPQNQHEREKQLQQMLDLAHIDGEFAPAERELIGMVAEKLGFSKQELDQIIAEHKKNNKH